MIKKLTAKQKEKLGEYREKWINIGLSTEILPEDEIRRIIDNVYIHILKRNTVPIIITRSPIEAWNAVCLYKYLIYKSKNKLKKYNRHEVWNEVRNEVKDEVVNEVSDEVWNEVWNEVRNEVWNEVVNEVKDEVWNEVVNEVWNEVKDEVKDEVRDEVRDEDYLFNFIYPYLDGKFYSSSYFSFYDFMQNVLNIKFNFKFDIYKETTKLELIYPLKNICIVSTTFCKIRRNERKQLHADMESALEYPDGFALYRLNGVKAPKEIVMTPANELKIDLIFKEKNVEVRRELIRKIGIKRVIEESNCTILEKSNNEVYELLELDLKLEKPTHYLKMLNPSIEEYHLEGVPFECDTIEKALAWRDSEWEVGEKFNGYEIPELLT
jgi:hypothetical protein